MDKSADPKKISAETVREDFNALEAVVHYTRAAHDIGLWASERILIERFLKNKDVPIIEAGCGAGRCTLGLWQIGYRKIAAFDFAEELIDQAKSLAKERDAGSIAFFHADATRLSEMDPGIPGHENASTDSPNDERPMLAEFEGALFLFNGLMQIPGRDRRREALRQLHRVCRPGAPFIFTTHDRDSTPTERALWRLEAARWERGEQDPRLVEFGDRYFQDETGRTFMHLPNRAEILEDLSATGWTHLFDALRPQIARENSAVRDFSDECRFWVAEA